MSPHSFSFLFHPMKIKLYSCRVWLPVSLEHPQNCHIRFNGLGDTQAQSDLFWPISRVNLIGGLWSIFNSLYRPCQSSSAQQPYPFGPFYCWLTVFWKALLEGCVFWQIVGPWRSVPFLLVRLKSPLLLCSHFSFLLLLLLVCLMMFGLVSCLRDLCFGSKTKNGIQHFSI